MPKSACLFFWLFLKGLIIMSTATINNVSASFFARENPFDHDGSLTYTLFCTVDSVEDIPDILFDVKISQSRKPELAGKTLFRHIVYKADEDSAWLSFAPAGVTVSTPREEIKQEMVKLFEKRKPFQVSLSLRMYGKWGDIETPDGPYALYDEERYPDGMPYYLVPGTKCDVTVTEASNHGNSYFQTKIKTDSMPDDIFKLRGKGALKYFGDDEGNSEAEENANPWA